MAMALGNKGTFSTHNTVGYFPTVKDGKLSVSMLLGDGNGTTPVLVHEQEVDLNEERSLLFEGHAREIIYRMTEEEDSKINFFKLANQLEHISARFDNPETHPTVRALLTAAEGTTITINSSSANGRGGYRQSVTTSRYHAALEWIGHTKSQWRVEANVFISDGVTKTELDSLKNKKG